MWNLIALTFVQIMDGNEYSVSHLKPSLEPSVPIKAKKYSKLARSEAWFHYIEG